MKSIKPKKLKKSIYIATSAIILAIAVAILVFYSLQPKSPSAESRNSPSLSSNKSGATNTGSISSSKNNTPTATTTLNPDITPISPTGTFVSNHRPNLDGSPAPSQESSTCTTTPGAKCEISFSNGDTVKTLPVKTTDSNGNVSWDWKLQDLGLVVGEWKITATASNGNKVAMSADSILLSVQQ